MALISSSIEESAKVAARPRELMIHRKRRNIPCANLERYGT